MKNKKYYSGEKALTQSQIQILLSNVPDLMEEVLIRVAIDVGLRRSDVVALRSRDVNLTKGILTFYEAKKKGHKVVPLSNETLQRLEQWMNINQTDWVFPSKQPNSKGHLSSKSAYNILRRNTRRAGLPDIPFHALRATCVKLRQKAGWSPEQTAKLIGDTVSTVQRHYSVPSDEELKELQKTKSIW